MFRYKCLHVCSQLEHWRNGSIPAIARPSNPATIIGPIREIATGGPCNPANPPLAGMPRQGEVQSLVLDGMEADTGRAEVGSAARL
jgi:hypothetical protein